MKVYLKTRDENPDKIEVADNRGYILEVCPLKKKMVFGSFVHYICDVQMNQKSLSVLYRKDEIDNDKRYIIFDENCKDVKFTIA